VRGSGLEELPRELSMRLSSAQRQRRRGIPPLRSG
jgi:hypothetical protein